MQRRFTQFGHWPKNLPNLSAEQSRIREDFYGVWLETLPNRYGVVENFNHRYPLRTFVGNQKTLDIGAGRGEHAAYEDLSHQEYTALELRPELAQIISKQYPAARTVVGDIQQRLDFADGDFDRIVAVHVLEHLPDLPRALDEIQRLLSPTGKFSVLMPCDPGVAYSIARNISARRIFEKRYGQKYDWFVACEHINHHREIMEQLVARFQVEHRQFFPLLVPIPTINLVIALTLTYKGQS